VGACRPAGDGCALASSGLATVLALHVATGLPSILVELRQLIRRIANEKPLWGEERIANELLMIWFARGPAKARNAN
jgi:hypothetical protein